MTERRYEQATMATQAAAWRLRQPYAAEGVPLHRASRRLPEARGRLLAYRDGLELGERELAEQEAWLQLGVLMLARIEGKSKVEYFVGMSGADDACYFGRWLLRDRPASLSAVLRRYGDGPIEIG